MGIKVKTVRNGDVRLLTTEQIQYSALEARVAEAYNLSPTNFQLFWTDEDGDKITIANQNDWVEAVSNHSDKNTIKLLVDETETGTKPSSLEESVVKDKTKKPEEEKQSNDMSEDESNPVAEVFSRIIDDVSTFLEAQGLEKPDGEGFSEHLQKMISSGMFPMPLLHVVTNMHCEDRQQERCPRRAHRPRRAECPRQRQERQEKQQAVPAGEYLPDAPLAPGSFGEGVEQLQHALIHLGIMSPNAIRWRAGVYAWNTANAIASLHNNEEDDEADRGKYTENIRTRLLQMLVPNDQQEQEEIKRSASSAENKPAPVKPNKNSVKPNKNSVPEQTATEDHIYAEIAHDTPILRRATPGELTETGKPQEVEENVYVQEPPEESTQLSKERVHELALKWSDQLQALLLMGFKNEHIALLETIEKHHGAMPFVVAELLSS